MRVRRGRDSDSAKEPETAVPTEPRPLEKRLQELEASPAEQLPPAPQTFEQFLLSMAVRAPELDGAAEAMATDVVRRKGFHHVQAWVLPNGSILITKG